MQSYRCLPSSIIRRQARSGPDTQGSPPIAQWSSSSSGHFGALCKCINASGFATRHYKAQSLRSVVVERLRCCVTSSAGPSHPEGANARTLAQKLTVNDVVAVLPKLVGAAALCMAVLRLQGIMMGSQPSLACAAVFLAKLPASILSPHQLLRSTRASSSASGAEGSGAAGITQQSIPQIPQQDTEGNGASGNGSGNQLQAKVQGTQEEQEDVRESVAGVVQALTELASVQTPASVWLPSKHLTVQLSGKGAGMNRSVTVGDVKLSIPGRIMRGIRMLLQLPGHLVNLIAFRAQQVMLGSAFTKLVWSIVVGMPLCAVGGVFYSWASGQTVVNGFVNAYGALYKIPGVTVIGEVNQLTTHVMNVLWLLGTFTFAIVIGIIGEDVTNTIMNVRSGNYSVMAANHTLILNWNDQTVPLLRQIAINRTERADNIYDGPVVVLAERDKDDMDKQLKKALGRQKLEWHTRSGAPHAIADLEKVAAGQARTIIVLQPDKEEDAGKKLVSALLGLQSTRAATQPRPFLKLQRQHLAVQAPEKGPEALLFRAVQDIMENSAQSLRLTRLSGQRDMSTLLAQSAFSPGVASVYCSIVQQTRNGVELYVREFSELVGMSFCEIRRRFDSAVVVGFMEKAGDLKINPPEEEGMPEGARVVALADDGYFKATKPKKEKGKRQQDQPATCVSAAYAKAVEQDLSSRPAYRQAMDNAESSDEEGAARDAKRVVVAWWKDDISGLLASLAAFAPRGSHISIVCQEQPEVFKDKDKLPRRVKFQWVEGDPASVDALTKARLSQAQALIIGGSSTAQPKEADAFTLTTITLAQEVLLKGGRDSSNPAHVVGMVRQAETVEVANFLIDRMGHGVLTAELLQPDELVSGIIAQVAAEPQMAGLLSGFIYSSEGQEIYLRRPTRYALPDDAPVSFAQVAELLRKHGELALGYITQDGHMRLAPRAVAEHCFNENDRLIILAR
ncbi:hypothetical protein CVIRNUC_008627 [Coccomyxa viridis]|uniref:CASTOR/POLLUX/SYM8 ion channel conserved domain-containing protein n=1 Tax=Coccomyxa viridis TaxID=1274662 RepID=A0AAV1IDN1_9CHLO|nr:hypothetical protein CVIRNUC_008627 [Coccomyxa viridis]